MRQSTLKTCARNTMALVALSLGAANAAEAGIVYVTWTGTVAAGSDNAGLFGDAGANLTGTSFTAYFTIDSSMEHLPDIISRSIITETMAWLQAV